MSESNQQPEILEFVAVAQEYCAFIDNVKSWEPEAGREQAMRLLCALYSAGIELPYTFDEASPDAPDLPEARWDEVFKAVGQLDLQYYFDDDGEELSPDASNMKGERSLGDFCDDLADIYRDIWGGLELYRAGEIAGAVWEWRFHYRAHWGTHALNALRALHHKRGPGK
jgi:hypothetical protein